MQPVSHPISANDLPNGWWERRSVVFLLVVLGLAPLAWPALPPLVDLPGHMGRWHVQMAIGASPDLSRYYAFTWAPVGNLGMDVLVPLLAVLLPFELAAKVGVMLIPLLTMVGMLYVARTAHGRIPPTALAALPFAYAWPFQFGFVNFVLAQGLALCAFGLWLQLGRDRRLVLRASLFAPIACLLWFAHSFGWALFCVMAAGAELARIHGGWRTWGLQLGKAALQGMPLALPILLMIASPSGTRAAPDDWFNWIAKGQWFLSMLRDRWLAVDIASIVIVLLILYVGVRTPNLRFTHTLGIPAVLCFLAFILLPRLAFGGAYVDMRILPATMMLALLAMQPPNDGSRLASRLAVASVAFFVAHTAATTMSFALRSDEQQRELAAINHIPRGAAVLSLVARPCAQRWSDMRRDHLPGIAIVRRDAFTNEQWALEGQQLLQIRHLAAAPYLTNPSQSVSSAACPDRGANLTVALRTFPRVAFTHVWTIGFAPVVHRMPDLELIWTNRTSALYQVRR